MRIEQAISFDSATGEFLDTYEHLERYVNDGSPSGEHKSASEPYAPWGRGGKFGLPYVLLNKEAVEVIGERRFYVHPDMVTKYGLVNWNIGFKVFPTSSARTVCRVDGDDPIYVKLHYDATLGRNTRRMSPEKVAQSILTSQDLENLRKGGIYSTFFGFFPETLGVIADIGDDRFGFIVRDFQPKGYEGLPLVPRIPWFSLFSRDKKFAADVSLLQQWVEDRVGRDKHAARKFVFANFLQPVVDCFVFLSRDAGFISDYNAQNILVIPNEDELVDRIVFRDLQAFYIDVAMRKKNKLAIGFSKSIDVEHEDEEERKYAYQQRSVYFDHKFSDYVLSPIIETFCAAFDDEPDKLTSLVKEYLITSFREIEEYFVPNDVGFRVPPGPRLKNDRGHYIFDRTTKSGFR